MRPLNYTAFHPSNLQKYLWGRDGLIAASCIALSMAFTLMVILYFIPDYPPKPKPGTMDNIATEYEKAVLTYHGAAVAWIGNDGRIVFIRNTKTIKIPKYADDLKR